jgi:hypothetical protein
MHTVHPYLLLDVVTSVLVRKHYSCHGYIKKDSYTDSNILLNTELLHDNKFICFPLRFALRKCVRYF